MALAEKFQADTVNDHDHAVKNRDSPAHSLTTACLLSIPRVQLYS